MSETDRITSEKVQRLLATRHSKDLFVAECKDGPSTLRNTVRADAWAMRRSWTNACMWGYEIKVNRNDFLRDNKWPAYLPLCNEFYFVAPKGVIQPEELSEGVGLLTVSANAKRLMTKRKAAYRDIEIPIDLMKYILMSRCDITAPNLNDGTRTRESRLRFWRDYLEDKDESKYLGLSVSTKIATEYRRIQSENDELKRNNERLQRVKQILKAAGVEIESDWRIVQEAKRLTSTALIDLIPDSLGHDLVSTISRLSDLKERLQEMRDQCRT